MDAMWANNTSDREHLVSDLELDYCFSDNKFLSSELVWGLELAWGLSHLIFLD